MRHVHPTGAERPVRTRSPISPSTWVASSSSVSPAEQAGALPSHDTTPTAGVDWTFSPTSPPTNTLHPVNADNPAAAGSWIVDTDQHRGVQAVRLAWPIAVSTAGFAGVTLAAVAQQWSPVGLVAVIAVALCAVLLATVGAMQFATDHRSQLHDRNAHGRPSR